MHTLLNGVHLYHSFSIIDKKDFKYNNNETERITPPKTSVNQCIDDKILPAKIAIINAHATILYI